MSKIVVRIDPKNGQNYIPRHIREDGFTGECEILVGAFTITFIKPGTNLADVDQSLQIVRQDIALRTQHVKTGNSPAPPWPLFVKFSRAWLSQETGYSKGYLCRVATGKIPLSRPFIERVCFKLNESERKLFNLDAG